MFNNFLNPKKVKLKSDLVSEFKEFKSIDLDQLLLIEIIQVNLRRL